MENENNLGANNGNATATEVSPASTDANKPAESSPAVDANKIISFDEAAEAIQPTVKADDKVKGSSPEAKTEDGEASSGEIQKLNPTEEKNEKPVEDDKLEFHKHPRFQELVKRDQEFKKFQETAEPTIKRLKSIDDYCSAHGISEAQFKDFIEVTALVNVNPGEAWKRLQPLVKHLQTFQGEILPKDIQDDVDAGTLPLARAKEIAALRTQKSFVEQRGQQTQEVAHGNAVFNALAGWENTTKTSDPDYAKKESQVNARFAVLASQYPKGTITPNQAIECANQAYKDVNTFLEGFVPKAKPTSRALSSEASRLNKVSEPKTWDEAVEMIQPRYK